MVIVNLILHLFERHSEEINSQPADPVHSSPGNHRFHRVCSLVMLIVAGYVSAEITNQQQADKFISESKALGFDTEQLIMVKQK
jgi:hypothetical protein